MFSSYDSWKLASPYDDDTEWEETIEPTCEMELDHAPDGHTCNDNCEPSEDYHCCGWNGTLTASYVGNEDNYTYYWTCPECGSDNQGEVN